MLPQRLTRSLPMSAALLGVVSMSKVESGDSLPPAEALSPHFCSYYAPPVKAMMNGEMSKKFTTPSSLQSA